MKLEIGTKIRTVANLGFRNNKSIDQYYWGQGDVKDIPIGSRGVIVEHCQGHYKVRFDFVGRTLCMDPNELEVFDRKNEDAEKKIKRDKKLEELLLGESFVLKKEEKFRIIPFRWGEINEPRGFLNWIEGQFPDIDKYRNSGENYPELEKRKYEVLYASMVIARGQGWAMDFFSDTLCSISDKDAVTRVLEFLDFIKSHKEYYRG